jgi:hypothetical protein
MKAFIKFHFVLGLIGICAACNGGGSFAPSDEPEPEEPPFGANYSEIQANVFTPTCAASGCHIGIGAPHGLRLDPVNSYDLLVNFPSSQTIGTLRVAPGSPGASYLIQKLEGTATFGSQMPFGEAPLSQATIDVIRLWILQGALDDRSPSPGPIRVTSLSPAPDDLLTNSPTQIVATFDRELDATTVNGTTFLLEASGGDGTFVDGNEILISATSITTPAVEPKSATFNLSGAALTSETYRVRLLGDGPSIVMDLGANALDGEFFGVFPSGNGTEGGDFEALFTIEIL